MKGGGEGGREENKEGACQGKVCLCLVSVFIYVYNDKITHVSKQV